MVVLRTIYYWTILTTVTTIFVYFTLVSVSLQDFSKDNDRVGIKKIVAYSLLKRIEIESEEYVCGGQFNVSNASGRVHNESNINGQDLVWTDVGGGNFYVSTVNLDARLDPYRYVRIVGMVKGTSAPTLYCQIRTARSVSTYHVTKATVNPIWSSTWDKNDTSVYFNPVLLSCSIPIGIIPKSVLLATTPCVQTERQNQFKLIERKERKNVFTVCVKPLDFSEDISIRLIQWIEISRILGADKIEFYVQWVRRRVWRVLKWYSSTYPEQIIVKKFSRILNTGENTKSRLWLNKFEHTIWQRRRYEVVAYNNCFYRHIQTSRFVVPLDIDEIIVPTKFFTWKKLFGELFSSRPELERTFASFTVPNTYFFGNLDAETIFFLRNLNRSRFSPAGESGKSFISTKNALTVFNHYALDVLRPGISRAYFMSPSSVQLNHYKRKCDAVIFPECVKYFSSPKIADNRSLEYTELFFSKYNTAVLKMQRMGVL